MQYLDVPTDSVTISNEDVENIRNTLLNSDLTIFGSETLQKFESLLAHYLSREERLSCIAMPNCTSAIFIALKLVGLTELDEIIAPNLTHVSAILAIVNICKCKIRLYDFSHESYNIDLDHFQSLITSRTKAVIVSYLHGYPFNIKEIQKICLRKNIILIEDAAQGLGVKVESDFAGAIGDYGCFSFGANKLLKLGEGGALVFQNKGKRNTINQYRHVGEVWKSNQLSTVENNSTYADILKTGFDYVQYSFNFRVNPLGFVLGISQIKSLEYTIQVRREKLKIYQEVLGKISGIQLISESVYNSAPISAWFLIDPDKFNINELIFQSISLGIPVGKFKYPVISDIDLLKTHIANKSDVLKNSSTLRENSIFLPLYESVSISTVQEIALAIKNLLLNFSFSRFNRELDKEKVRYFNGFFLR